MPTPRMTRSRAARPAAVAAASLSPSPLPRAKSATMRSRSAVSCARTAPASVHAAASASATTGGDSLPSALAMNASTKNVVAESESIRVEPLDAVTTLPVIDTAPSLSPQASRPARSWWITAALCALNALLAGSAPPGAYASTDSFATRVLLMAHVFLGVCALVASMPRLAQPLSYHNFVDQRALCCGVPNTLDVASNLPFLVFGVLGLLVVTPRLVALLVSNGLLPAVDSTRLFLDDTERNAWLVFFWGSTLTAFGSAYYHWRPNNARLVWDRLPMTLGFMSIYAIVLHERLQLFRLLPADALAALTAAASSPAGSDSTAAALLAALRAAPWLPRLVAALPFALTAVGAATVAHWAAVDDLRAYFIVQFYPLLTIPALLLLFPAHYSHAHHLVGALGWYALAKAAEVADRPVFRATCGLVSGHTLKHLIASLSMLWCIFFIVERRPLA